MGKNSKRYYVGSFFWGTIAKILDAGLKFITIPLLLAYFGDINYGLLTLAIATNAYMRILNMGMNTGAVKFFSQWISSGKTTLIDRVARTNLTFFILIGILNSIILLVLAFWGQSVFSISIEQFNDFRKLLFILATVSIFNWMSMVFFQLLVADEKIAYTQQVLSAKAILNLLLVLITIQFQFTLLQYFLGLSILNVSIIIPYSYVVLKQKLVKKIRPAFYWNDFKEIISYSLAIFAISLFQFTATQSRPIVLGIFSNEGPAILSDYRIIEVFPLFIISIGTMLISILLPKSSKAIQEKNTIKINNIAYTGTKYSSILVACLCFPVILNAENLLRVYVGGEYANLANWLIMWCFTVVLYLHNSPVSSLVLATGKTRTLVYSSAISSIISIAINAILTDYFGVGSAVIGYLTYIIIQMSFYYLYFNRKVLKLRSYEVFKSFIIPSILGTIAYFAIQQLNFNINGLMLLMIIKSLAWLYAVWNSITLQQNKLQAKDILQLIIK